MELSRRDLLRYVGYTSAGFYLSGCKSCEPILEKIKNRPMRRDIGTLPNNDPMVEAYRMAVTKMRELPSSDPRNWTRQAQIHQNFCPHGNWVFLPWHRAYLFFFEDICRKLSNMPEFALPYWNWSKSPQIPDHFWGGTTNALFHANRGATASSTAPSSSTGGSVVNGILNEPNFELFGSGKIALGAGQRTSAFYGGLEGTPHNNIHGFVSGDMGTFMSPLDPLFWCHHNMIEACWSEWNFARNHPNTNDSEWTDRHFTEFSNGDGVAQDITTGVGLLYPIFSYQFDTFDLGLGAPTLPLPPAPRPRWDANPDEAKSFAEKGGDSSFTLMDTFTSERRARMTKGAPARLRLPVNAPRLKRTTTERGVERAILMLTLTAPRHADQFSVRVFLERPDAGPETSIEDPGYVGTFALFLHGGAGHEDHPEIRIALDASPALRRLRMRSPEGLEVSVVLVPFEGRAAENAGLDLVKVELGFLAEPAK